MSWVIDPKTGDYVMTDGKPTESDSPLYPAYYRLTIARGRWLYAPDTQYGSDLGLQSKRSSSQSLNALSNIASRALQPLLDDGRAISVDVALTQPQPTSRNQAALDIEIVNPEGVTETLSLPPIGG